jgi:ABC-type uncharacterized transport system substrate-binding protein
MPRARVSDFLELILPRRADRPKGIRNTVRRRLTGVTRGIRLDSRQPSSTEVPMRRIGLAVVLMLMLATLVAEAQQTVKTPQVGLLSSGTASAANVGMAHVLQGLRDGLAEFAYVERQNVAFEYRWAEEKEERLPALAADLVERSVDVIVAAGPSAIKAAKNARGAVPIVAIDFESDPVAAGFATSFARPGGNITGYSSTRRS